MCEFAKKNSPSTIAYFSRDCAIHSLQLVPKRVVHDAPRALGDVLAKVRSCVRYLRHSTIARQAIGKLQKDMGLPSLFVISVGCRHIIVYLNCDCVPRLSTCPAIGTYHS